MSAREADPSETSERHWAEDRLLSAAEQLREYGVELALSCGLSWLAVVLGNPATYAGPYSGCLGATLPPVAWGALAGVVGGAGFAALGAAHARGRGGVARGVALLAQTAVLVWVGCLIACGRQPTVSLGWGFTFLLAALALGRFFVLSASLARDEADDDDTTEPEADELVE